MIPILYESTETSFTLNGIGRLSDMARCIVTEERNGIYECEFDYPVDGRLYSEITFGRYIYCSASQGVKQPFEIYASSKPIGGVVTFYARHISYRASLIPVKPFTATSPTLALDGLVNNSMETNPFSVWTNKSNTANYNQTEPSSFRSRLGGVSGSILDVYGGEYEWDKWTIKLWNQRGSDKGVKIVYGKNLTDLTQEESIEETITGVAPYYKNQDEVIYGDVQSSAYVSNYPYPRTICVDVSEDFDDTPTKAQVNAAGVSYLNSHSIGVPKVSLTISFVNLADTEEYKNIAVLETVRLCDTVTVEFARLGVSASAKVIKTVWDALLDKYQSIELGEAKSNLTTQVAEQIATTDTLPTTNVLQQAIDNATSLITGNKGGYVVIHEDELTGEPYEILIMDTNDINTAANVWRWNQSGWGHSSTGYAGPYTLAATIDGGIVADFITAGTITGIAINNGNGTFTVDASGNMKATSGEFTGDIKSGSTITGATLTGDTISGGTITGTDISGGTLSGGAISGGTISGTTITGSSLSTTNGITVTNNVITFSTGICAMRNDYASQGYGHDTTIAQSEAVTAHGETYYLVQLINGYIRHGYEQVSMNVWDDFVKISAPTGQFGLEFDNADQVYFTDNNGSGQPVHGRTTAHTWALDIENGLPVIYCDGTRLGTISIY